MTVSIDKRPIGQVIEVEIYSRQSPLTIASQKIDTHVSGKSTIVTLYFCISRK